MKDPERFNLKNTNFLKNIPNYKRQNSCRAYEIHKTSQMQLYWKMISL
jgi:hypothetical protein